MSAAFDFTAIEAKIFAKIFYDGVSAVNSGSGEQWNDGLKYLENLPYAEDIIEEYKKLVAKSEDEEFEDEDEEIPMAVKQPLNAYIFFCKDVREKIIEENPTFGNVDIVQKIAHTWKGMNQDQKAKYVALAAADKERYETELRNLNLV